MVEPAQPGIRKCLKCDWLFVSPDVLRISRCSDCKQNEDSYTPREASTSQLNAAVRAQFGRDIL